MDRTTAISWVISVCAGCLRLSQAKTLSILVASCLQVERLSLGNLGRKMLGTTKHQIKRCGRFIANNRIETADAMRGAVKRLLKKKRKKPLLVSFDWTDVRGMQTLMAAAVFQGRSVPLCWASCPTGLYQGDTSRNGFEESLLYVLKSMLPKDQKIILLADRGFGRTELGRFCQAMGFSYLVRIKPDVWVQGAEYSGKLLDYPVHKGICRMLKGVLYRQKHPLRQNVVIRWKRNLPKERDECWFLMTDLNRSAESLTQLYGRRTTVEELFRDHKSKRNGWSLRDTQVTTPERLDRLLLIAALAYWLLCGLGLHCRAHYRPGAWCSNNHDQSCSAFAIGKAMLEKVLILPETALAALIASTLAAVPGKWG